MTKEQLARTIQYLNEIHSSYMSLADLWRALPEDPLHAVMTDLFVNASSRREIALQITKYTKLEKITKNTEV